MKGKKILSKTLFSVFFILSIVTSLITAFILIGFVLHIDNRDLLQMFIGFLILTSLLWAITFLFGNINKDNNKKERKQDIKDLVSKLPLILLSSVITSVYILIYFFFFSFMTVSNYGKGGVGAESSFETLFIYFIVIGIVLFGAVMYKVFKTDKTDISLTLYNQFSVLKWSSLIVLPFGLWASYYFYHTEKNSSAWIAMIIWGVIFYGIYKLFNRLSEKVHDHITNSHVNRILHEKKKKVVQDAENKSAMQTIEREDVKTLNQDMYTNVSIADELKKFKDLLDQGAITNDEYEIQKKKLIG